MGMREHSEWTPQDELLKPNVAVLERGRSHKTTSRLRHAVRREGLSLEVCMRRGGAVCTARRGSRQLAGKSLPGCRAMQGWRLAGKSLSGCKGPLRRRAAPGQRAGQAAEQAHQAQVQQVHRGREVQALLRALHLQAQAQRELE